MLTSARSCLALAIFAFLTAVALPSVWAQLKPRMPAYEESEASADPPTSFWGTGLSPGRRSVHGRFTSHQINVNVNGQNIVGDAANEPSITVDPTDGSKMAVGWRQFNSITSNFRRAGWAYTSNGGLNWTFPGSLENVFRSDPVLYSDDKGQFFYLSLKGDLFDTLFSSNDGGQTWMNPRAATGSDKQWAVIDNTNSSGHGFQYQAWSTGGNNWGGRQFTRSTDGGLTWMDPIFIPESPSWGTLDVDSNGNVFIGGVNFDTGQFWCIRSTDAKVGSVTPTFDQTSAVDLGGDIGFQQPINPVGLVGQCNLAVDRSGTGTNNNVYMLASVIPSAFGTGSDVMFNRSTDGGRTFGKPIRLNDDPVNSAKWHWMAAMSVAPNGRIDAVWLDTRNAANNTDSQLFYAYSTDGGVTWSENVPVSDLFNPFLGYPNQEKLGDYMQIVSDNGGGNVAYPATLNGEEDIYFVRVSPEGGATPTPTPTPTPSPSPSPSPTPTPTLTPTPVSGDFDYDGDGRSDISVFRPSTGAWYLLQSSAGFSGLQFGIATDKIAPADYDGDGKTDIAVYRPSNGVWFITNSSNATVTYYIFGLPEDLPAPADYDGDGRADICVFRPSTGTWYRQNSAGGSFFGIQFGLDGDRPTVGDFDGDGKSDIGIWRPSNGDWYHILSSAGTVFGERFGLSSDKSVPADYDGDGKTDIAVYRPDTGHWFIKNSATNSYSTSLFGLSADIPAPGDFDGDGKTDLSVFRPSDGTWYINNSSNGLFTIVQFGLNGDVPTQAAYAH